MIERTLVVLKPDAIERKLYGKIINIFEEAGLNIVAMKLMNASENLLRTHYQKPDEWKEKIGGFVFKDYEKLGLNVKDALGTDIPKELGQKVLDQLVEYMMSTPVLAFVLEGNEAVTNVRRIVGDTYPIKADPGSLRGKYSVDSADLAAIEKRAVKNLVHASGEKDEADVEINLWFPELKK